MGVIQVFFCINLELGRHGATITLTLSSLVNSSRSIGGVTSDIAVVITWSTYCATTIEIRVHSCLRFILGVEYCTNFSVQTIVKNGYTTHYYHAQTKFRAR